MANETSLSFFLEIVVFVRLVSGLFLYKQWNLWYLIKMF